MTYEDPRPIRSRQALIQAMTEVLDSEAADQDITVADLARLAGVSRPTLYQHFGDLATLTHAAALARLEAAFAQIPEDNLGDTWTAYARNTFHFLFTDLDTHARFYRRALQGPAGYAFSQDVVGLLARRLLDTSPLGPIIRRRQGPDSPQDRAEFLAAGVAWHVIHWLQQEPRTPNTVDEAAERVSALLLAACGATKAEIAAVEAGTVPPGIVR